MEERGARGVGGLEGRDGDGVQACQLLNLPATKSVARKKVGGGGEGQGGGGGVLVTKVGHG